MGILVLAVAILPLLGVGGAQIVQGRDRRPDEGAKLTPRIADTAQGPVTRSTCAISLACFFAYRWRRHELGRRLHAHVLDDEPGRLLVATTPASATGTRRAIECGGGGLHAARRLQLLAALPGLARGARCGVLLARRRGASAYACVTARRRAADRRLPGLAAASTRTSARRCATRLFNVVSIATTTGYASADYNQWPIFAPVLMLLLVLLRHLRRLHRRRHQDDPRHHAAQAGAARVRCASCTRASINPVTRRRRR
ncbi:MAG: hypothetical protein MZW92_12770 [Comamonadaceae bacterium]|nr:hypothetical protein [Comamonadaceae bacterium]